jgi:alpha-L-fucosidase 2
MLLQSHSGEISLLPSLPVQWADGAVEGLRATGGFDVDMKWKNSILSKALIKANYDIPCRFRTKTPVKVFVGNMEVSSKSLDENLLEFDAKSGEIYCIEPVK